VEGNTVDLTLYEYDLLIMVMRHIVAFLIGACVGLIALFIFQEFGEAYKINKGLREAEILLDECKKISPYDPKFKENLNRVNELQKLWSTSTNKLL
jgi:hypothetical protein